MSNLQDTYEALESNFGKFDRASLRLSIIDSVFGTFVSCENPFVQSLLFLMPLDVETRILRV